MKGTLLKSALLCTRHGLCTPSFRPKPTSLSRLCFFSSGDHASKENPKSLSEDGSAPSQKKEVSVDVEDVSTDELRNRIQKFYDGDFEAVPSIMEAILARRLLRKHAESDDELMEEIRSKPLEGGEEDMTESDSEELHENSERADRL